jgi:hypothetical protein
LFFEAHADHNAPQYATIWLGGISGQIAGRAVENLPTVADIRDKHGGERIRGPLLSVVGWQRLAAVNAVAVLAAARPGRSRIARASGMWA